MKLVTLEGLLSHLSDYLGGKIPFSAVRNWVFDYYISEEEKRLDAAMEQIIEVLRPYLEWEEASGDPMRESRMQRVYTLLRSARSRFAERAVFALEFDEAERLTKKLRQGLITKDVYLRKMGQLSPADYDVNCVIGWAEAHVDEKHPVPDKLS